MVKRRENEKSPNELKFLKLPAEAGIRLVPKFFIFILKNYESEQTLK